MSQLSDGFNTRTIMRVQGRVSAIVFSWSNVSSHMSRGAQGVAHFDNSSDHAAIARLLDHVTPFDPRTATPPVFDPLAITPLQVGLMRAAFKGNYSLGGVSGGGRRSPALEGDYT
jgi:hypothetical protein